MTWAQRLKQVFGMDIETCPARGGAMRIIAGIEYPDFIEKILTHLDRVLTFMIIADDGLAIQGAIIMPTGITTRYRGLVMGPDNALYAAVDDGIIYKITATLFFDQPALIQPIGNFQAGMFKTHGDCLL
ncbi:MAG: hypothetical protein HKN42_11705 [Granulosicoccus sp.]|nr:hypothetical protein [Granulosicoccus sp.]